MLSPKEEEGLTAIQPVDPTHPSGKKATQAKAGGGNRKAAKNRNAVFDRNRHPPRRRAHQQHQRQPPPISYSFLSTRHRSPAAVLSSRRGSRTEPDVPGPGAYHVGTRAVTKACCGGPKFRAALREADVPSFLKTGSVAPGPGAYSLTGFAAKTKGFTIGGKLKTLPSSEAESSPGPAAYRPPLSAFSSHRGATLAPRTACATPPGSTTPGPGAYYHSSPFSSGKAVFFSGRTDPPPPPDIPGPGAYDDPGEMGRRPGTVTLKGRTPLAVPMKGQGPPSTNYNVAPPAKDPPAGRRPYLSGKKAET